MVRNLGFRNANQNCGLYRGPGIGFVVYGGSWEIRYRNYTGHRKPEAALEVPLHVPCRQS